MRQAEALLDASYKCKWHLVVSFAALPISVILWGVSLLFGVGAAALCRPFLHSSLLCKQTFDNPQPCPFAPSECLALTYHSFAITSSVAGWPDVIAFIFRKDSTWMGFKSFSEIPKDRWTNRFIDTVRSQLFRILKVSISFGSSHYWQTHARPLGLRRRKILPVKACTGWATMRHMRQIRDLANRR